MFTKHILDKDLIFRDKTTGEIFLFDLEGLWDEKGLENPLIYWKYHMKLLRIYIINYLIDF